MRARVSGHGSRIWLKWACEAIEERTRDGAMARWCGPTSSCPRSPSPSPCSEGSHGRISVVTTDESFFLAVGGHDTFTAIVDAFYDGVARDEVLRPMYPEDDMAGAKVRLQTFLEQYWGGPTTYSDERGHPRLRMRHAGYKVNPDARDRWIEHMRSAVVGVKLSPMHEAMLLDYVERAAHSLLNTFDD